MSFNPSAIPYSRPHTPSPHGTAQYGFIGLGNMGFEMALNLARSLPAGTHLTVWNRTRAKCDALLAAAGEDRVRIAHTVQEVVQRCYVVITSLGTDQVVEETYEKLYKAHDAKVHQVTGARTRTTIFIDTSTIYPTLAAKLDSHCEQNPHRHFLMCPIFGPPAAAKSAQLVLVLAGAHAAKKEVAYALVPAIGRKIIDVGENVERAASFKLIGNGMILGTIEMLSEAMTMAEKSGLGGELFYSFIKDMFPAPSFIGYGAKILTDDFDGSKGFAIEGGLKDAGHIRRLVEEKNCPMPMVDIAHQHMLTARAYAAKLKDGERRWKELDWSAMVIGQRLASGLEPLDPKAHTGPVLEE
ncbi:hypothetical protein CALCODRAFT_22767 [Calocera cornea HHB12733]|uniref:NAD(P)-binding protein n=1 Tax=Calocera cornea HHB12733 TaxID=1353952 RepID=A0A165E5E5_9BASI|nr:hypothetical protein CALCODRAFT_22767 [Calocera cornea HHB12733]